MSWVWALVQAVGLAMVAIVLGLHGFDVFLFAFGMNLAMWGCWERARADERRQVKK